MTTTLTYRPPEMIDTRRGWPINQKVDMWMFGCVAFLLLEGRHPFQDQGKLAIVGASYAFSPTSDKDTWLINIIRRLLVPDPTRRPNASEILLSLESDRAEHKHDGS